MRAIHSVDSVDLLRRLDAAAADAAPRPDAASAGRSRRRGDEVRRRPNEACRRSRDAAQAAARRVLIGLMLLPPWFDDPEQARPYFRAAARAARPRWSKAASTARAWRELSMGMSHDFEVAIQEGATLVRVGTAIFGKRIL